jgi:hypothetical protein
LGAQADLAVVFGVTAHDQGRNYAFFHENFLNSSLRTHVCQCNRHKPHHSRFLGVAQLEQHRHALVLGNKLGAILKIVKALQLTLIEAN